jgi:transcriptional regulator with XRE-family HTH domain
MDRGEAKPGVGRKRRRTSEGQQRVDIHIGRRLRLRRMLLGLTQVALARSVGVTFQQIQNYERGSTRMGAGRLAEFAAVLGVAPAWFFENLPAGAAGKRSLASGRRPAVRTEDLGRPETLSLVRLYYAIKDRRVRGRVLALVRAVAFEGAHNS